MTVPVADTPAHLFGDGSALRAYFKEIQYMLLKLVRERGFAFSVIGFPVVFFLLFGLANRNELFHGHPVARYLVVSYSCFGAMGAAFFAVGVGLAYERGHGWLELKRISPMPTAAYLFSKIFASIVFALVIVAVLITIGLATTNMRISILEGLHLAVVIAGGVVAFASMGVLAGLLIPPSSAASTINFIYLPLSLCGGLWMPIEALPNWLQSFARLLPSYYYSRLGLHALGYFDESETVGWLVLAGYAIVFTIASAIVFRKQEAAR